MRTGTPTETWKILPIAEQARTVFDSGDADSVQVSCPSLLAMPGGRLVAAFDLWGPGVKRLQGAKGRHTRRKHWVQGRILTSNDQGETWTERAAFPFSHPCLFRDSQILYLVGQKGNLEIMRSADGGTSWSSPVALSGASEQEEHLKSPASVCAAGDFLYMPVLRAYGAAGRRPARDEPPRLEIRAIRSGADALEPRNWRTSAEAADLARLATAEQPVLWQEPHCAALRGPSHASADREGPALCVLASLSRQAELGALVGFEDTGSEIRVGTSLHAAAQGLAYIPTPCAGSKFDLFYDDESGCYWLAGNPAPDRPVGPHAKGGSFEEYRYIVLSYSRDLLNWHFAALVADAGPKQSLFWCSMSARGKDLYLVARATAEGEGVKPTHTTRVRLFHVSSFRDLVYF